MERSVETAGELTAPLISTAPDLEGPLEILLLGGVGVRRQGQAFALPRSRKCRALIAYLAATSRPQRREHLCELFWQVPDDPKGALRWSLSKLRPVLGEALITDRESVALDSRAIAVDSLELCRLAERLDETSTDALEAAVAECGEGFGVGLELPRCPEFQAWLMGVREDVRQAQLKLLSELLRRLEGEPERALPHARTLVALDPLDEQARLCLITILQSAERFDEAEQQRQLSVSLLEDAGIAAPSGLARPVRPAGNRPDAASPFQRVQFCTSADGTAIAYSAVGSGPPLVKTANWMGHLEFEWQSSLLRHWLTELSRDHRLVRYDARGNGLSDRSAEDLSLEAFVEDLKAVTATVPEGKFDLIGISQGAALAIAYAAKYPERVRKLVLFAGFASGWRHHQSADVQARWNAMITLAEFGWGTNNPAFRQMFTTLFAPQATSEQAAWFNELQRASASPHEAQRLLGAIGWFDVSDLLHLVRAPTIVFHCRGDALVPFGNGRQLALAIEGAEFVGLESDNHLPLEDEPAWSIFVDRLRDFLSR